MKTFVVSVGVDSVEHILHIDGKFSEITENEIREELKGFFSEEYVNSVQIFEIKES